MLFLIKVLSKYRGPKGPRGNTGNTDDAGDNKVPKE